MSAQVWVVPDDGGWGVNVVGDLTGSGRLAKRGGEPVVYRLKVLAVVAARALAIYLRAELVRTNRRGVIQGRESYGPDPEGRG